MAQKGVFELFIEEKKEVRGRGQQFEGVSFNDETAVSDMALSRESSLFQLEHKAIAACPLRGDSTLSHKMNKNSA